MALKENLQPIAPSYDLHLQRVTTIKCFSQCPEIGQSHSNLEQNIPGQVFPEINYSPVSDVAFLPKFLVKSTLIQITAYIEYTNLFFLVQSAYQTKHSTETVILKIVNNILLSLHLGKGVIVVLLSSIVRSLC